MATALIATPSSPSAGDGSAATSVVALLTLNGTALRVFEAARCSTGRRPTGRTRR